MKGLRTARFPSREVSFSVGQGEILGMAGLVGAGRTEVAQAICGIDKPQAGSMTLDQKPVEIQSPRDAVASGIYLVPDDRRRFGLVIDMSVPENMTLPALERYSSNGIINRQSGTQSCRRGSQKAQREDTLGGCASGKLERRQPAESDSGQVASSESEGFDSRRTYAWN